MLLCLHLQRYVKCPLELQALQLEIVISEDTERETQRQALKVRQAHCCVLAAGLALAPVLLGRPCCWDTHAGSCGHAPARSSRC